MIRSKGVKESRIRGFKGSSGERQKTEYRSQKSGGRRRLEGWLHIHTSKHINFYKTGLYVFNPNS